MNRRPGLSSFRPYRLSRLMLRSVLLKLSGAASSQPVEGRDRTINIKDTSP